MKNKTASYSIKSFLVIPPPTVAPLMHLCNYLRSSVTLRSLSRQYDSSPSSFLSKNNLSLMPPESLLPYLRPGTVVEFLPNGKWYHRTWFLGTVIRRSGKKDADKFLIEYHTLFNDDARRKPVRERIHFSQLRPPQPLDANPREFKFEDAVDAYYEDAWWEGNIAGELGNGRFKVYFRPLNMEIEFGKESLRLHREWENGVWKPALEYEEQERKATEMEVGPSRVPRAGEETSHHQGAPVVHEPTSEAKAGEEGSRGASHESEPIRTVVHAGEDGLPGVLYVDLRIQKEVNGEEAYQNTLVESEPPTGEGTADEEASQLALVQNACTSWVLVEEAPTIEKMKFGETYTGGAMVEVSINEENFQGAWFLANIVKPVGEDKYLIEYATMRSDDEYEFLREEVDTQHLRPYPPNVSADRDYKVYDEVDCYYDDGWWVGVISEVLERSRYRVYFMKKNQVIVFHQSDLRIHQDWIDGKWVVASQALKL